MNQVQPDDNESREYRTTRHGGASAPREAHRRLSCGLDAADACGWALAMLPDSRCTHRLMLDWLLNSGQHEEVVTRTGALLHANADDWRLWLRRAEALLALDRADEASEAIGRTLAQRPHHRRGLLLAADVAARRDDSARALAALELANDQHPRNREITRRLIDALLAADRANDAAAIRDQLTDVEPQLSARVLAAQGRLLDARLLLEDAIHWELDEHKRDDLRLALIDVLERAGDHPTLRALAECDQASPAVAARLVDACLSSGAFAAAQERLRNADVARLAPLHTAAALAAAIGHADEAIGMLASPHIAPHAADAPQRMRPWLRALRGLIISEQLDAHSVRRAGADPTLNVLLNLLPGAMSAFESALHAHPDAAQAPAWAAMHEACEITLQRLQRRETPERDHAASPLRHRCAA